MKKLVSLFILLSLFGGSLVAQEDSVIGDLLRSPEITKEKKKPLDLRNRIKSFSKGLGYLAWWGVSAGAINHLLAYALDNYKHLRSNQFFKQYEGKLVVDADLGILTDKEKTEMWWEAFNDTVGWYWRCAAQVSLAGAIAYYFNWKPHVQSKTYKHFKKSFE